MHKDLYQKLILIIMSNFVLYLSGYQLIIGPAKRELKDLLGQESNLQKSVQKKYAKFAQTGLNGLDLNQLRHLRKKISGSRLTMNNFASMLLENVKEHNLILSNIDFKPLKQQQIWKIGKINFILLGDYYDFVKFSQDFLANNSNLILENLQIGKDPAKYPALKISLSINLYELS